MEREDFGFSDSDLNKVIQYLKKTHITRLCLNISAYLVYPFISLGFYKLGFGKVQSPLLALPALCLIVFLLVVFVKKLEKKRTVKFVRDNNLEIVSFEKFNTFYQENKEYKGYAFINYKHYTHYLVIFFGLFIMQLLTAILIN